MFAREREPMQPLRVSRPQSLRVLGHFDTVSSLVVVVEVMLNVISGILPFSVVKGRPCRGNAVSMYKQRSLISAPWFGKRPVISLRFPPSLRGTGEEVTLRLIGG